MRVSTMLSLAVAMMLTFAFVPIEAAVSEEHFVPGKGIQMYHSFEFDLNINTYLINKLILMRAVPIFAIGIFFFFMLVIWSCCECCKCCRCCECAPLGNCGKTTYTILAIGIGCAGVAMLIYGFSADKEQHTTLTDVPTIIDSLTGVVDSLSSSLVNLKNDANILSANFTSLSGQGLNDSALTEIKNQVDAIVAPIDSTKGSVDGFNFGSFKSSISDQTDMAEKYRHLAMAIILAVMFVLLIVQLLFGLMNRFASEGCKPRKCCKCFTPIVTAFFLLVVLLAWLLSAILLVLTAGTADFCIDPTANVLSMVTLPSEAQFYLTCDTTNAANPFASSISTITTNINASYPAFDDIINSCSGTPSQCQTLNVTVNEIRGTFSNMVTDLGLYSFQNGDYTSGMLQLISCDSLNGKYNMLVNQMCGSFFTSVMHTFEVIVAFSVLMVCADITRRRLSERSEKVV